MPLIKRTGKPALHYLIDDFTDPWTNAGTIILQHGYGRSARFWYSWVPYLSRFYKVVRPDMRGHGESPVEFDPATDISLEALVDDLVAVLDDLDLPSVHYCGESFGGILGMALAATRPERVRTLSLVSAPVHLNERTHQAYALGYASRQQALRTLGTKRWAAAIRSFPAGTDPGLCEWYAAETGKSDVEVLCGLYDLLCRASAADLLPAIKAPVLGLYPTSGAITSREQEERLVAGIKNLCMIHMPIQFHSIAALLPAACARHVLHFAARHDGIACHE